MPKCKHDWLFVREVSRYKSKEAQEECERLVRESVASTLSFFAKRVPFPDYRLYTLCGRLYQCADCPETREVYGETKE